MKIDVGKIALVAVMIAGIQTGVLYHRIDDLECQRDIYKSRYEDWEGVSKEIAEYADTLRDSLKARDRLDGKLLVEDAGDFLCTAYCTEKREHICGTGTGITASGAPVEADVTVAADPDVFPFGTVLYIEDAPRNSTELTSHEIGVLLLREKYILDKIKEYQALPPDQMITSSVMDMRVPGGRGKRKRDGANQQIGMYQKETPAQRILQLQEALNKIHGRILSAAAQMQKNEMDKLHLETEQQRLELLRIRATGEIGEPGDGDKDAVHE